MAFLPFFLFVVPQSLAGHREYNQDQQDHQQPEVTYVEYLGEGHFVESIFENWESEFLQIFGYVLLTAYFRQKGSPESKKLEGDEPLDADPAAEASAESPWPVRRGGAWLRVYSHSLSIAFAVLFPRFDDRPRRGRLQGVQRRAGDPRRETGQGGGVRADLTLLVRVVPELAERVPGRGLVAVFGIFLRERGSPESKPVAAPHRETGGE
ncbi:MAG: hypothetical protein M3N31_05765 [Actinomycetota bacterium]|nr:hypothetical protein [Actinomycetota bacterium]